MAKVPDVPGSDGGRMPRYLSTEADVAVEQDFLLRTAVKLLDGAVTSMTAIGTDEAMPEGLAGRIGEVVGFLKGAKRAMAPRVAMAMSAARARHATATFAEDLMFD